MKGSYGRSSHERMVRSPGGTASPPAMRTTRGRQRPGGACEECRRRKLRCDGQRPQCRVCQESGVTCEVTTQRATRGPKKGYMKALKSRVGESSVTSLPNPTALLCLFAEQCYHSFFGKSSCHTAGRRFRQWRSPRSLICLSYRAFRHGFKSIDSGTPARVQFHGPRGSCLLT